jgi:O-antigen/teichoic acid export membrane protein
VFSTNVLFLGLSVVTSLLSAWAFGPGGRGELAIITLWLYVFALIGTLGLPYAHRYWTAKKPEWNSHIFTNTVVFSAFASVIVFVIGWFAIPVILADQEKELVRATQLFLLNVPVILLTELLRGQLEGAKLFGWMGAARIAFIAIQAFGYLVFYFAGLLDLRNALFIIIVAQVVCASIMFTGILRVLRPRLRFSTDVFRRELHYGLRGYVGVVTEFAVWRLDQILLTALASASVIGLYVIAVAIAEISVTLASSVSDALMPEVASSKNPAKAAQLLAKSLRLTVLAQLIALIPLWLLAPYVLRFVFGQQFVAASGVLRLLLVASIFWGAGVILISGLNGFGKPGLSTLARIGSAVTTVITLLLLMPTYGVMGAAISSILGYAAMSLIAAFFLLRHCEIGVWEFFRPRSSDIHFSRIFASLNTAGMALERFRFRFRAD